MMGFDVNMFVLINIILNRIWQCNLRHKFCLLIEANLKRVWP